MKIGIDISQIVYGTGVSVYTRLLVEHLVKIHPSHQFVLFGGSLRRRAELVAFAKRLDVPGRFTWLSPLALDFLWNRLHLLPIEQFIGKTDVFHSSDWAEPPVNFAAKVTTVHDLSPLLFPEETAPSVRAAHLRRLGWVKKESKLVVAVSESTKKDLVDHLGIEKSRIRVIYEAAPPDIKRATATRINGIKKKFDIKGAYLLAVGTTMRKNVSRTISAFKKLKEEQEQLSLVIVGPTEWKEEYDLKGTVKFIGQVSNRDLAALYSGAQALIYPSLYEGFGLPILEAFSCGCPVVTSNLSSMPEVAGEAAVLVDPKKPEAIAAGIEEAMARRDELIEKGFVHAKKFSWEKAARETLAVYEEAIRQ